MKKLIFAFALMFGAMFASCNHTNSTEAVDTTDSIEVVDSMAVDTVAVDSVVADTVAVDSL